MRPNFHLCCQNLPSLMILTFLSVHKAHHLLHLLDRQVRLESHQDGLQLLHLLVERARILDPSRERLPQRPSPPEPHLIPIPMSDGDDDQPPQDGRGDKGKSNGLDRVSEYTLTHKCLEYHKFNLWLIQNLMMYQMRISQLRTPHHRQLDHRHWLNREVAAGEMKDPDRVSVYLYIHLRMPASSHNLLYLLFGILQTQTLATQGSDEDSAFVDPHNRVSDRSRSPQEQEGSRRQGPQTQKGKTNPAEKQPSTPQKA